MSRDTLSYILGVCLALAAAATMAQQPQAPTLPPPPNTAGKPAMPTETGPPPGRANIPYSPGEAAITPRPGTVPSTPPPALPTTSVPLAYSASRSETALRIEDLMRGAAALRTQGNFSKAMELYNEALRIAPQYAEAYRQRALTLVRLGDRVQAQVDYNRFLDLDRQALAQLRQEITLFEQSGRAKLGEAEAASYSYGNPPVVVLPERTGELPVPQGPTPMRIVIARTPQERAEARFTWAEEAFQRRDYDTAFQWAARSNEDMPQARTRALMAQILFAQGDFRGAAAEARAAAAMGPVTDWRTVYSYYNYTMPNYSRQFHALEDFVRRNPSSADGHFLLGYEHLVLGQMEQAHAELAIAAVMEPTDVVAVSLLAKDGVEIVGSHRPLVQTTLPREGLGVARRTLPPPPPAGTTGANRTEVRR